MYFNGFDPLRLDFRVDPCAVHCAAGEAEDVRPRADLVDDVAGFGAHAWEKLDTRAADRGFELVSNACWCESARVPHLILVVGKRVAGWIDLKPIVRARRDGKDLGLNAAGLRLSSHSEHLMGLR